RYCPVGLCSHHYRSDQGENVGRTGAQILDNLRNLRAAIRGNNPSWGRNPSGRADITAKVEGKGQGPNESGSVRVTQKEEGASDGAREKGGSGGEDFSGDHGMGPQGSTLQGSTSQSVGRKARGRLKLGRSRRLRSEGAGVRARAEPGAGDGSSNLSEGKQGHNPESRGE
ncbi:unnamed protein product, partial [Discosporangium mesarthrocarpum]